MSRAGFSAPTAWDLDNRNYHRCPMHTLEAPSGASGVKGITYMPSSATLWAAWERCGTKDWLQHPCATEHSMTGSLLNTYQLEEGSRSRGISLAGTQIRRPTMNPLQLQLIPNQCWFHTHHRCIRTLLHAGIVVTGDREIAVAENDPFAVVVYGVSHGSAAVIERQSYNGLEQEARSLAYEGATGVFYTTAVRTDLNDIVNSSCMITHTQIGRLYHCDTTLDDPPWLPCNIRYPLVLMMVSVSQSVLHTSMHR